MHSNQSSCYRCVGNSALIKYGKTKASNQRYFCKACNRTQVESYIYNAYLPTINYDIVALTKEGVGMRSTARILKISTTTLLKRIIRIAQSIKRPVISKDKIYEIDEMRSYVRRKEKLIWIVYALDRETKNVISFNVGNRTNNTLNVVEFSI
jgi:insertion element IS1 protein InsB